MKSDYLKMSAILNEKILSYNVKIVFERYSFKRKQLSTHNISMQVALLEDQIEYFFSIVHGIDRFNF